MEMSVKFTSSNGCTVEMLGNRRMIVTDTNEHKLNEDASVKSHASWLDPAQIETLREYFQHERDQDFGRWRWPENPDYVVSLSEGGEAVWVLNEREAGMLSFTREMSTPTGVDEAGYNGAARAYFAAHPEPEPLPSEPHTAWVDKYGTDIWWVDGLGKLRCCASPSSDPAKYAPFTRLVPEVSDVA